jgi:enamine deaminase RidA (YjgF/YER057c/UK114 family)
LTGQPLAVTLSTMSLRRLGVPDLHETPGYAHATVTEGPQVHLSGQCPLDGSGQIVGRGDVAEQSRQVAANAMTALEAAGATPEQVVRTVIYVASHERADLTLVWDTLLASPLADAFTTASTLVGVTVLGFPDQLVELDVTAVADV